MNSVLVVVTPAANQDLTSLALVKAELGITGNAEDTNIGTWIDQASAVIASYCNRVFGSEAVRETFRRGDAAKVILSRGPVTVIASVVEDGIELTEDEDFECDYASGILTRLCNDYERRWCFRSLVVTYTAGYTLLTTLPDDNERAAQLLVKGYRSAASRDPLLKSEEIPGVLSQSWWVDSTNKGLPSDVESLIAPYRFIAI